MRYLIAFKAIKTDVGRTSKEPRLYAGFEEAKSLNTLFKALEIAENFSPPNLVVRNDIHRDYHPPSRQIAQRRM